MDLCSLTVGAAGTAHMLATFGRKDGGPREGNLGKGQSRGGGWREGNLGNGQSREGGGAEGGEPRERPVKRGGAEGDHLV